MSYIITILISIALLVGFGVLAWYEEKRGERFFTIGRAHFDTRVERIEFILKNVDLGAFVQEEISRGINNAVQETAHLSLIVVRATERLLTRTVRSLRARSESESTPRESSREFVKTLSDFKSNLKTNNTSDTSVHNVE